MDAIPSHWTGQPPVLELTGPHPGGALQPKSMGDANAAIAKILPRPMRPSSTAVRSSVHLDRLRKHFAGLSGFGKYGKPVQDGNGTVKCERLARLCNRSRIQPPLPSQLNLVLA